MIKPSKSRVYEFRLFASVVPPIIFSVYFFVLWLTVGIVWSIHLSLGSIVVTGIAGWLISYTMIPPKEPADEETLS